VNVLGRFGKASFFCFAVRRVIGFGLIELPVGATRYARPCRPVKPLLMICEESARSERQRAQRRWEVAPVRKDGSSGGELLFEEEREFERAVLLVVEEVLEWRRRKGREGTR
jgi:hypothetical protein